MRLRVANYVPYSMLFWTNVQNLGLGCWLVSIVGTGHWLKGRDEMRARGDEADKGQCCVNNHNHIK